MEIKSHNSINCCFCDLDLSPPTSCQQQLTNSVEENKQIIKSINKYKCPACERLYCSANCFSGHKEKFDCSGIRDKVPYVHLSKFDQKQFLDDYFFLEEVNKKIESAQKVLPRIKITKPNNQPSNSDSNKKKRNFKRNKNKNKNKNKNNNKNQSNPVIIAEKDL